MPPKAADLVRRMSLGDLGQVLEWRNHPDVRRYMFSTGPIALGEHAAWYQRASIDERRHLLIFESNSIPLGFINIHCVSDGGIAEWGFYASPSAPRGTGLKMTNAAVDYAFTQAKLHKVCGKVLAHNDRSIRLHLNLGFSKEGVLKQQHFDGEHYCDVILFGLLSSERSPQA